MTKKTKAYTIASPEGVAFVAAAAEDVTKPFNVGDKVELELDDEKELAVVAAGWLTTDSTKGGSK